MYLFDNYIQKIEEAKEKRRINKEIEAEQEKENHAKTTAVINQLLELSYRDVDLEDVFNQHQNVIKFGAFVDGENVYETNLPTSGILVLGNEANGISQAIESIINQRISIPRFGDIQETESLNVANATAILLSEFRRRSTGK